MRIAVTLTSGGVELFDGEFVAIGLEDNGELHVHVMYRTSHVVPEAVFAPGAWRFVRMVELPPPDDMDEWFRIQEKVTEMHEKPA